jgi:hypothetical protein
MRNAYKISVGKPGRKRLLGRPGSKWRELILQWILGKWGGKMWSGYIWHGIGTNGRLL